MQADSLRGIALEQDEHIVRQWAADAVELDGAEGPRGWFILTNQRCLFALREGWFGARASLDPGRSVRLESIRYAGVRPLPMSVGFGERRALPGLELDGRGYRTGRSSPPGTILVAIARVRLARREALGLTNDAPQCTACGATSFPWSTTCPHCDHSLGVGEPSPARFQPRGELPRE